MDDTLDIRVCHALVDVVENSEGALKHNLRPGMLLLQVPSKNRGRGRSSKRRFSTT